MKNWQQVLDRKARRSHFKWYLKLALVLLGWGAGSAWAGAYEDFLRALQLDDAPAMVQLLRRGLDPNTVDPRARPALTAALDHGSLQVAEVLLAHPGVDVNRLSPVGESALMLAALRGHLGWCEKLISRGADVNKIGWTPLHYAASQEDVRIVRLLLDHHAYIDAESPNKTTPLMMAARYGSEEIARHLLDEGADPTLRNERGLGAADFARAAERETLAQEIERRAAALAERRVPGTAPATRP